MALAFVCVFVTTFRHCKVILLLIIVFVAGEVERLLREYRQNQELVRNIGAHYYQIIYPVQLRHHEKMGISTREIGAPKVRKARSSVCSPIMVYTARSHLRTSASSTPFQKLNCQK